MSRDSSITIVDSFTNISVTLNAQLEVRAEDLAAELKSCDTGLEIAFQALEGDYEMTEKLAESLTEEQRLRLADELLYGFRDKEKSALVYEHCEECQSRDMVRDEVAEIEGERHGN